MKKTLVLLALGTALAACSKKKSEPPPAAFTLEQLMQADGTVVSPGQKFADALGRLEAKLGKPQFISESRIITVYYWALEQGDKCSFLAVQKGCDDGGACAEDVGVTEGPTTVEKPDGISYDICVAATYGKAVGK